LVGKKKDPKSVPPEDFDMVKVVTTSPPRKKLLRIGRRKAGKPAQLLIHHFAKPLSL